MGPWNGVVAWRSDSIKQDTKPFELLTQPKSIKIMGIWNCGGAWLTYCKLHAEPFELLSQPKSSLWEIVVFELSDPKSGDLLLYKE